MLAVALIVFREVLEAALVVSIVMAASRGLARRGRFIGLGIGTGLLGSLLVAALAHTIAASFQGTGQEIVNAGILSLAVVLIGWHVAWMNSHGRALASELRATAQSVVDGKRPLSILSGVVGLAVMREGSEVVLILHGLWADAPSLWPMAAGATLGLLGGILAGTLIYLGFLTLSVSRLFAMTNGLLILIAAGMAAHAANFLTQADLLPALGSQLWNTSAVLDEDSPLGRVAGALIGYIARPSGIEVLFYLGTVVVALLLLYFTSRMRKSALSVGTMVLLGAGMTFGPRAEANEVMSPYVEEHEWEIENEGIATLHDNNRAQRGAKDIEADIGYSPTAWWRAELETEFIRQGGPDQAELHYDSFNVLDTFQLAEPGKYWIDPGLFAEMDFAKGSAPNSVTFGLIGAKQIGDVLTTMNLFGHKDYGRGAAPIAGITYSDQTRYLWRPFLTPGFEIFGDTEGATRFSDQQLAIGPGIFGKLNSLFNMGGGRDLKYEATMLFGTTRASPAESLRWKLEYEYFF